MSRLFIFKSSQAEIYSLKALFDGEFHLEDLSKKAINRFFTKDTSPLR